jgi:hypothetical protein
VRCRKEVRSLVWWSPKLGSGSPAGTSGVIGSADSRHLAYDWNDRRQIATRFTPTLPRLMRPDLSIRRFREDIGLSPGINGRGLAY